MEVASVNLNRRYYKPSGKFNVGRTLLFTLLISLVIAALSVIYSCVMKWIPIVQLNFIITFVMAFALYFAQDTIVRAGQIRNNAVDLIVRIILFLVFVYWHFIGYAAIHLHEIFYEDTFFMTVLVYLTSPGQLVQDVMELNGIGTWTMFDLTFKGIILTVVWVIEHIAVLYGVLLGFMEKNKEIYIESRKCWAGEMTLIDVIRPLPESVKESFEGGDFRAIETSTLADEGAAHCVISYFTDIEGQSGEYYLKVTNVAARETSKNILIMGLEITEEDLNHIQMLIDRLRDQWNEGLNELLKNLPNDMLNELANDMSDELVGEAYDAPLYDGLGELKEELRQKLLDYLPGGVPDELLGQLLDYLLENRMDGLLNNLLKNFPDDMQDDLQEELLDGLQDELSEEAFDELLDNLRDKLQDYMSEDMSDELQEKLIIKLIEYLLDDSLDDLLEKLPTDVLDGLVDGLPDIRRSDLSNELKIQLMFELRYKVYEYLPGDLKDDKVDDLLLELLDELYYRREELSEAPSEIAN